MKIICGIYKITSPSNRVYIGQSINCLKRQFVYKSGLAKTQRRLHSSINKYGWGAHKFEIIHECNREELNELEIYYIHLFGGCGRSGLNIRLGGECGGKPSTEYRHWTKFNPNAKSIMLRISKTFNFNGRHHSEESKKNISEKMTNRIVGESTKAKLKKIKNEQMPHHARPVLCVEKGMEFISLRRAGKFIKDNYGHKFKSFSHRTISLCCDGIYSTAYGFSWKFINS